MCKDEVIAMITALCKRISLFLYTNGIISEDEVEICQYGALRKNLCKIENCDKNDITGATVKSRSNFLQYTTDTVICQDTSAISLMEWSEAEWNQADSRRLSRAGRGT